jgi:long-chain acyl-CoA synthetase
MNECVKAAFCRIWDKDFIVDPLHNKKLTGKDFFSAVLHCKKQLEALGLCKQDKICLLMNNSLDLVVMYFASLFMQLIIIPIDPHKGQREIDEILKIVNGKKIFCDTTSEYCGTDVVVIESIRDKFYASNGDSVGDMSLIDELDFSCIYLITFTSGTTGICKGVRHSFNNLIASARAFSNRFNFDQQNVFYHNVPMTYMAGILNLIILPFVAGSTIVLGSRFDVSQAMNFWDVPSGQGVNTFWFVPTMLSLLLKFDRGNKGADYLRAVKAIGCVGTAPLNVLIKKQFEEKYGVCLYESYGLSETLFVATNSASLNMDGSVGTMLDGVTVSVEDDGELVVRAPWMFLGYVNMGSNQDFARSGFKSGDIGDFGAHKFLFITDRKKDLIIRGGINISPARLNRFINETGFFEENVVAGVPDDIMGEKNVCFFVKETIFERDLEKKLNMKIMHDLGTAYCIDEFIKMDIIPKNLNGKTDTLKLREFYCKNHS